MMHEFERIDRAAEGHLSRKVSARSTTREFNFGNTGSRLTATICRRRAYSGSGTGVPGILRGNADGKSCDLVGSFKHRA